MKKTSRERTDIFYNSKNRPQRFNIKMIIIAVIVISILSYLSYQYGANVVLQNLR